jgi:hypothetical protein
METAKENSETYYREELHSIKEELVSLRNDFSRFLQRTNQQHIEGMIGEMRKSFMKPMVDYLCEDASERMHTRMTSDCGMRDFCETAFQELLQETAGLVGKGRIEAETIKLYRDRLEELKKESKSSNCSRCFSEATNLFEKQINSCVHSRSMKTGKKIIIKLISVESSLKNW